MRKQGGALATGQPPEKKAHIEQILRTTGGSVDQIVTLTGASDKMVYKTMAEHRDELEIIGFAPGRGNKRQKVVRIRRDEFPFKVGEYVEIKKMWTDDMHQTRVELRGGSGATYEVVVP